MTNLTKPFNILKMKLPEEKQSILDDFTNELKNIDNIKAIVLGGSYATGMATGTSDLDIGVYYFEEEPFDINAVKLLAEKYANVDKPTVTGFYEWGPWVNGGAWIKTAKGKVDILYKNIDQITSTIANAKKGVWENHFEQQPPYGFSSLIFLAETQYCIPLYDPQGIIQSLKSKVEHYPEILKQTVIQQSLWSTEFTIWHAEQFALKGDVYNTMGCLTRAVKNIVATLFSINGLYPIGDKRAIEIIEQSKIKPAHLTEKIDNILCADKNSMTNNIALLKTLFNETVELAEGKYKPFY